MSCSSLVASVWHLVPCEPVCSAPAIVGIGGCRCRLDVGSHDKGGACGSWDEESLVPGLCYIELELGDDQVEFLDSHVSGYDLL